MEHSRMIQCPAKLNLGLFVGPPDQSGYHEIASVFCRVDLYDELIIKPSTSEGLILSCSKTDIPVDRRNLVVKAYEQLNSLHPLPGLEAHLIKHIPHGAGIGGGSSNAGCLLLELSKDLPISRENLKKIALEIGADVPFFLENGPCLTRGIGEKLTPLLSIPELYVVLIFPEVHFPTGPVFKKYDEIARFTDPCKLEFMENVEKTRELDLNSLLEFRNDLQVAAEAIDPSLKELHQIIESTNPLYYSMSGSGATYYGLYEHQAQAFDSSRTIESFQLDTHVGRIF